MHRGFALLRVEGKVLPRFRELLRLAFDLVGDPGVERSSPVVDLTVAADGSQVLASGADELMVLYRTGDGSIATRIGGVPLGLQALRSDGVCSLAATVSSRGRVRLFDLPEGYEIGARERRSLEPSDPCLVDVSPDGSRLALGLSVHRVRTRRPDSGGIRIPLERASGYRFLEEPDSLVAWRRGSPAAPGEPVPSLELVDTAKGQIRASARLPAHSRLETLSLAPRGRRLAVGLRDSGTILVLGWGGPRSGSRTLPSGRFRLEEVARFDPPPGPSPEVRGEQGGRGFSGFRLSEDGTRLAVATRDRTLLVLEVESRRERARLEDLEEPATLIRFSGDGRLLAAAQRRHVRLVDLRDASRFRPDLP